MSTGADLPTAVADLGSGPHGAGTHHRPGAPPDASRPFDDDYVDLGRLQGNIGDQNYELPADIDPGAYASVVVWCDRFDSAFGAASLTTQ